jgi:hypothetical protein
MEHYLVEDDGTIISSSQHHPFRDINKNLSSLLGIVLTVQPCDNDNNLSLGISGVYRGVRHECTVLCNSNYDVPDILIPNVIITPSQPSNINNYEENLPKGCTSLVDGQEFDTELVGVNPYRLDGEWCIVEFINGNSIYPYIGSWWPHPANIFDPSTSGRKLNANRNTKTYLVQADIIKGKSRHYNSSSGIVSMISADGDCYYDTQEAGRKVIIDENNNRKVENFGTGGNVQVDIKPSSQFELNWNTKPTKGPRLGAGSNSSNPIQEKSFPHYDDPTIVGTPEARPTTRTTIRHDAFSMLQKTSQLNIYCEDQSSEEGGKSGEYTLAANDLITLSLTPSNGKASTLISISDGQIMITTSDGSTVAVSEDKVNLATSSGGSVQLNGGLLSILAADGVVMNTPVSMGTLATEEALLGTTFSVAMNTYLAAVESAGKTHASSLKDSSANAAFITALTSANNILLGTVLTWVSSQIKVS